MRVCLIKLLLAVVQAALLLPVANDSASAQTNCVPPPLGLAGWWRAEGSALDCAGGNNGTWRGIAAYGPGEAGQGFVFPGNGSGVQFSNSPALRLQTFTIEAWIKRASASMVSYDPRWGGAIFSFGSGGYSFAVGDDGHLVLDKLFYNEMPMANRVVTGTNWHHVAVTKSASTVMFYCDGVAYPAPAPYDPGFTFTTFPLVGVRGSDYLASFLGTIDEVSIYNRALSGSEIRAIHGAGSSAKCPGRVAPSILSRSVNQTAPLGASGPFKAKTENVSSLTQPWYPPSLKITRSGGNIVLSWPLWATNFALQEAQCASSAPWVWRNLPATVVSEGIENVVARPVEDGVKFYRLIQP
jgi:hypothetical protein